MASTLIRFLRAFAWLRWRLAVSALRGGRRRDALESFSRLSALVVPLMLFGLILGFAALLGVLGYFGGVGMGSGSMRAIRVMAGPRVLLFLLMLCMVVIPTGGMTVAGHARLLLLPIPRRALHFLEVLTSIAGPWIAGLLPGLALIATGLLVSGRAGESIVAFAAAAALIVFIASLNTAVASLTHWVLRNRRRSELVAIVGVLVLSLAAVVPALSSNAMDDRFRPGGGVGRVIEEFDRDLPEWTRALPTELYGRSIEHAVEGRDMTAWFSIALLALEATALYALSSLLHKKLLESSDSSRGRSRTVPIRTSAFRIPGLSSAASAIAITQLRTSLRSVRGRVAVMLPGPFLAILAVCSRHLPTEFPGGSFLGSNGPALLGAGIVFSMYALLAFTMNQFATDRTGLALLMLAPVRDVDLVRGKLAGCALVLMIPVLVCFGVAITLCPTGTPHAWIAVLLAAVATQLLLSPVAVVMSALFPVAADLSKTGSGGNPHGLAMLTGTLLVLTLASVPTAILAIVERQMQRPGLALALVVLWTIVAALIALPLIGVAARAIAPRRENLVLVARGR